MAGLEDRPGVMRSKCRKAFTSLQTRMVTRSVILQKPGAKRPNGKPLWQSRLQCRSEISGRNQRSGIFDDEEFLCHQALQQCGQICLGSWTSGRPDCRWRARLFSNGRGAIFRSMMMSASKPRNICARLGHYDGEIDGNIGSGSRKAIEEFQKSVGMKPDRLSFAESIG